MTTHHSDHPQTPRLRVLLGEVTAMGPGKAMLLEAIREKGSISAAARSVGMSYRRAWDLVETMNQSFREPMVETAKGGSGGGGAQVTEFGERVLARYREMEARATAAIRAELDAFSEFLADSARPD
ncbi:putative transcriptional regulator, ModE family [Thioalkalivibrio sp. K90mix]|uniref:winged helix-turn-helix domain-containing protein n=1 Tax=Thioalkalivibrio sp. (strain K90mix) TaxID=396595 RepID=UPI00019591FF|nr:LysR family transcriptional regulator [Thioalkalivibrio sp. K90mix]ADC72360.1 putative transcriptional regulator, ModE family [Thioalkalivibrio sp. K90mix]